jgi:hypothetical protein
MSTGPYFSSGQHTRSVVDSYPKCVRCNKLLPSTYIIHLCCGVRYYKEFSRAVQVIATTEDAALYFIINKIHERRDYHIGVSLDCQELDLAMKIT